MKIIRKAAGVLLYDSKTEKLLAVVCPAKKRKCGIPFGKVEQRESLVEAAIRECYEETGYNVALNNVDYFEENIDGVLSRTYKATSYHPSLKDWVPEPGNTPEWLAPKELLVGIFKDYNQRMLNHFGIL